MKILVINADCITVNTSANLCHLAYIRGLLDAGHDVTLISADGRDYSTDPSMEIPEQVEQHHYYSVTLYEKLSLKKRVSNNGAVTATTANVDNRSNTDWKNRIITGAKALVLSLYGVHGIYSKFIKKAQKFKSDTEYEYVISISTPVTSHLVAYNLLKSGRVKGKHWIQIWEDPWYSDAYGFNGKETIFEEEKRLLSFAEKVCYVSPLTLRNQQKLFPESAHKMFWQPLPYYYKNDEPAEFNNDHNVYGYFGAYTPQARDLKPFYMAAKETGIEVNICGDPSDLFEQTENIHIFPRLTLDKLKPIEDNTNVLIFLCNRKGGQIPGKIYQYSATNKTVLFIMDGTEEEQEVLRSYFEKFNRYVFCQNNAEDIACAIRRIENGEIDYIKNEPLEAFNPIRTINNILESAR